MPHQTPLSASSSSSGLLPLLLPLSASPRFIVVALFLFGALLFISLPFGCRTHRRTFGQYFLCAPTYLCTYLPGLCKNPRARATPELLFLYACFLSSLHCSLEHFALLWMCHTRFCPPSSPCGHCLGCGRPLSQPRSSPWPCSGCSIQGHRRPELVLCLHLASCSPRSDHYSRPFPAFWCRSLRDCRLAPFFQEFLDSCTAGLYVSSSAS